MKEQVAIQRLLHTKLAEIQRANPRYSLRAYAQKVGVHAGALSHILNGKRNVSREMAARIANRLLLDPQERSELLGLFPGTVKYRKQAGGAAPGPRYLELTANQFKTAAEWEHFAVMSLVECSDFDSRTESIAARLGITLTRCRQVVERLLDLGILTLRSGRLVKNANSYRTPDDFADISLKKHHEQSFELAKASLYRDPIATRDFTSITMAIDPKKLNVAKERIRKFQDELSDLLESGNRTEVYRLCMQLFPLSRIDLGDSYESDKKHEK